MDDSAEVLIIDNDNSSISISVPSGREGQATVFTVTLSEVSSTNTVISYEDNGTATVGTDYTNPSGSLTIAAGQTTGTISVPITLIPSLMMVKHFRSPDFGKRHGQSGCDWPQQQQLLILPMLKNY